MRLRLPRSVPINLNPFQPGTFVQLDWDWANWGGLYIIAEAEYRSELYNWSDQNRREEYYMNTVMLRMERACRGQPDWILPVMEARRDGFIVAGQKYHFQNVTARHPSTIIVHLKNTEQWNWRSSVD